MDFCTSCGSEIEDWDSGYYARQMMCINCYNRKAEADALRPCTGCGVKKRPEQLKAVRGKKLCADCATDAERSALVHECATCHRWIQDWETKFTMPNGHVLCEHCHSSGPGRGASRNCAKCGQPAQFPFYAPDGQMYCEQCAVGVAQEGRERVRSPSGRSASGSGSSATAAPASMHQPLLVRVVNRLRRNLD